MIVILFINISLVLLLIILSAIKIVPYQISTYELNRRAKLDDENAKKMILFNESAGYYRSIQKISESILLVIIVLITFIYFNNKVLAILICLTIACFFNYISGLNLVVKSTQIIVRPFFNRIINFLDISKKHLGFLTFIQPEEILHLPTIVSKHELETTIKNSKGLLSPDEKNLIINSISFYETTIKSIMTKRSDIAYINKSDFLGPLTLSELYKKGYFVLPVISKNLDQIVGILYVQKLLMLENKNSTTAEKEMDTNVYYINQNQTLREALEMFMSTKHYMSIVVNEKLKTVGIITLGDLLSKLFGRHLVEELEDSIKP